MDFDVEILKKHIKKRLKIVKFKNRKRGFRKLFQYRENLIFLLWGISGFDPGCRKILQACISIPFRDRRQNHGNPGSEIQCPWHVEN